MTRKEKLNHNDDEKRKLLKMTDNETLMHVIEGNLGVVILVLPSAFASVGILPSTICLFSIAIMVVHCTHIMIRCSLKLCERFSIEHLDYAQTVEKTIEIGPKCFQSKASFFASIINFFLLICQLGFCSIYCLFICKNLHEIIKSESSNNIDISVPILLLILWPFMVSLNLIRHLKHLAVISTIGNVLQIIGITLIFFILFDTKTSLKNISLVTDLGNLPIFLSIAVYTFSGIGIKLPLLRDMKDPEQMRGCFGVLNTGMMVITILNYSVGFFGYLRYGKNVKDSITLNFPPTVYYESIRVIFTMAIFFSYAIHFYVPLDIIWKFLSKKYDLDLSKRKSRIIYYSYRILLVTMTIIIPAVIPMLEEIISLIGAIPSCCITCIAPPFLEICFYWNDERKGKRFWIFLYLKNSLMISVGILVAITGTYTSIFKIIKKVLEPSRI